MKLYHTMTLQDAHQLVRKKLLFNSEEPFILLFSRRDYWGGNDFKIWTSRINYVMFGYLFYLCETLDLLSCTFEYLKTELLYCKMMHYVLCMSEQYETNQKYF